MRNLPQAALCAVLIICSVSLRAQTSWQWAVGSHVDHGVMEAWPMALDKDGNIYELSFDLPSSGYGAIQAVLGPYTVVDSTAGNQGVLVSADSNGAYRWVLAGQGAQSVFMAVGTDTFGYVYVLGSAYAPMRLGNADVSYSYFVAKINSSGVVVWVVEVPSANVMAVSPSGNVYVGGSFLLPTITIGSTTLTNNGPSSTADAFIAAFDSSGASLWAANFGGAGNEGPQAIAISPDNDVYVAGNYTSPDVVIAHDTMKNATSGLYEFMVKYSPSGAPQWGHTMPGDTAIIVNNLAANDGGVYFTGLFYLSTVIFAHDTLPVPTFMSSAAHMIIGKYDSLGNQVWAGCNFRGSQGYGLAFTPCGNIWLSCGMSGFTTGIPDSAMLLEYDPNGVPLDSAFLGSGGDDQSGIAADKHNNLFAGGDYYSTNIIVAGPDTLRITDSSDETLFIAKLHYSDSCTAAALQTAAVTTHPAGITIFPNPASDECTIQSGTPFAAGSSVTVYDMEGRAVHTYPLSGNSTTIPTQSLPPGMYLCSIHEQGGEDVVRKLVVMR